MIAALPGSAPARILRAKAGTMPLGAVRRETGDYRNASGAAGTE